MPWGGRCAPSARTRWWSSAWGAQSASVHRGWSRSVEVAATAAAMVAQGLCGRSVSKPVTERSRLSRLGARRHSGAKGSRYVASSGSVSGLACGTTDVSIRRNTASIVIQGNTAYASIKRKMYHKTNEVVLGAWRRKAPKAAETSMVLKDTFSSKTFPKVEPGNVLTPALSRRECRRSCAFRDET
jgi:hypothetical protein